MKLITSCLFPWAFLCLTSCQNDPRAAKYEAAGVAFASSLADKAAKGEKIDQKAAFAAASEGLKVYNATPASAPAPTPAP